MFQIDPWEKAAECDRAIRISTDPVRKDVLSNFKEMWITLGNRRFLLSARSRGREDRPPARDVWRRPDALALRLTRPTLLGARSCDVFHKPGDLTPHSCVMGSARTPSRARGHLAWAKNLVTTGENVYKGDVLSD
jgi:hypothetical protein